MTERGKDGFKDEPGLRGGAGRDSAVLMTLDALADLEAMLGREQRDALLRLGIVHGERARAALGDALRAGGSARAEAHALRGAVAPFGVPALAALLKRVEEGEPVPVEAVEAALCAFVAACRAALDD